MDEYQMEFATGFGESYLNCPACGKEMISGHSECFSCGVVVDRFQDRLNTQKTKSDIGGIDHLSSHDLKRLDKRWKQVVVNYHDQKNHQDFISFCQKNRALPFASYHYSKMLEIDKADDIAIVMRRQVLTLLSVPFETLPTSENKKDFYRVDIFLKWFNWVGLVLSASCVVAGLLMPQARNLIGLGAAVLCLFVALYYYRRS